MGKKFLTYGSLNIPIGQKDATSVKMGKKSLKMFLWVKTVAKKSVEQFHQLLFSTPFATHTHPH